MKATEFRKFVEEIIEEKKQEEIRKQAQVFGDTYEEIKDSLFENMKDYVRKFPNQKEVNLYEDFLIRNEDVEDRTEEFLDFVCNKLSELGYKASIIDSDGMNVKSIQPLGLCIKW